MVNTYISIQKLQLYAKFACFFCTNHYCTLKVLTALSQLKSTISKLWYLLVSVQQHGKRPNILKWPLWDDGKKSMFHQKSHGQPCCFMVETIEINFWEAHRRIFQKTSLPSYPASKYRIIIISHSQCNIHRIVYKVYPLFFYFFSCAHFQIQWTRFLGQTTLQQTGVNILPTKTLLRKNPSKLP